MDEENQKKIKQKNNKIRGLLGDIIKSFSPIIIIAIIASIILILVFNYFLDTDIASFKDKDESNVPFNFLKYYSDINISQNGKIVTKQNVQEIWDNIIKNEGEVDEYLNNALELKKLMDAQLVTQFPDTRPNPDENLDWNDFFNYNTESSDASDSENNITSEIQGIVKFKRAKDDGTKTTMTYVDESTFNFYMNEYMQTGSEDDKQRALNVFTIGKTPGTRNSANLGASLAGFTTEEFLQAVRDVAANVYDNRNIFRYGNSSTTPPCEWETDPRDGATIKFMACDRLVSKAIYNLGVTDMHAGGLFVTTKEWFSEHGFIRIDEQSELQAGDIIIFGNGKGTENENWVHTFVLESYDHATQTCSKYDMGSDERIQTRQPFINAPFDEWDNKDFICGYRVNYATDDRTIIPEIEGLGERRDITATTLDKDNNNLVNRMQKSLRGSSYSNLSYLIIPYYNFKGQVEKGEMVVSREVADEVLLIFQELYMIKYPIEEMKLVDEYDADDWTSIQHNNTSAFNYRHANDSKNELANLSNHAYGKAIDINPLVNPYILNYYGGGTPYTTHHPDENNRELNIYSTNHSDNVNDKFINRDSMEGWSDVEKRARIARGTDIYNIFTKYGWSWLERTGNEIDAQHFEKLQGEAKVIDWSKVSIASGLESNTNSSTNVATETPFIKYQLTDHELTGLTAVAFSEQGTPQGAAAEASLMANLFELKFKGECEGVTGGTGLYNFVGHTEGSEYYWFYKGYEYINSGHLAEYAGGGPVTEEMKAVVKSVLVDGKRILPGYIDEHDSWSGKDYKAIQNGADITNSRELYVQFHTHIDNDHGSSYTFWGWADPNHNTSDPFGYTSEENRVRIGEFHYDFNSGNAIGETNVVDKETTYYVKVAKWDETVTEVKYTEPGKEGNTSIENRMSVQKINYQDFLNGYTMPFNYLWAMLVITEDTDFVMALADLVYNSEIEITIHDNFCETTSTTSEDYWTTIQVPKGRDRNGNIIYGSERASFTKITTQTNRNTTIDTALTKANVWIVDYKQDFEYKVVENGSEWEAKDKYIKEKTDRNSSEPNFVTELRKNSQARKALEETASWLFEVIEEPDNGMVEMLDLTKYLLYKALGNIYDDVKTYNFDAFDPDTFKKSADRFVGSNLEEKLWWLLKNIGYSDIAAAGAMGNFSAETDDGREIHSDRVQSNGEGIGIVQWSFGRKQGLLNYAASKGSTWQDENIQLEFLKAELTDGGCNGFAAKQVYTENSVLYNRFINAETPEEAAVLFDSWYERSGGSRLEVRRRGARFYYEMFKGKERPVELGSNSKIIQTANKYVGNPYVYGGNSLTNGCDCSHFVYLVLIECGKIPQNATFYTTKDMNNSRLKDWGAEDIGTDISNAQAGDIILYGTGSKGIHHVAFYDGNGLIIEAQSTSAGITNNRTIEHEGVAAIFRIK